ncbi:universal stress protein [Sphingobacterium sp. T2]|uniref:universal stress protein n=1 Tax=Sphingobacterium sp. T2 TaxID=1590596 RepID=UPI00057BB8AA|nr:universal stress protein [Sphingobacterium sp. T2]
MKKFKRILIAIDESPCATKVIDYTKNMIVHEEASVALLTVIPPTSPASYGADPLLGQQPIVVPEITEAQQQSAESYLHHIAEQIQGAKEVFSFTRIGSIKEEILMQAEEWSADLIIVGSNGRTGFDHFISGNLSEAVIRKASCPVLVIPINCS